MRGPKHSGWTDHPDGSATAKIGRYSITIMKPWAWQFWRGDHKGIPCHEGPGVRHTVAFHGQFSGGAFTMAGAKAYALWVVQNDMTGHSPPDSLFEPEELAARRLWEETVEFVDRTFGDK